MGKQIIIEEINLCLPDKLKIDLDILIDDVINSKMDCVIVIDGKEGAAKSTNARLIGKYISHRVKMPFSSENIHFSTDKYIDFSENQEKYTINILDESREALNKKRGMSRSNVKFTNWLSENRDKNQFHILILPAIHDLDSYISVWRMKLLIHFLLGRGKSETSYSGHQLIRGKFRVYNNNKDLQRVIFNKNRYGHYSYPLQYNYERTMKYQEVFTCDELEKYNNKKATARRLKYQSDDKRKDEKTHKLLKAMLDMGLSRREISRKSGMGVNQVCEMAKEIQDSVIVPTT